MNFWKLGALFVFAAITGFCVSYAHSAEKALVWKSSAWLGSCGLRAEQTSGADWNFVPTGYSGTKFSSVWPNKAGDLFLSAGPEVDFRTAPVGVDYPEPYETLTIKFALVNDKPTPVSYVYENLKTRKASRGLIQPMLCALQQKN